MGQEFAAEAIADTGAGLERILALLQGVDSVRNRFMQPLLDTACSLTGKTPTGRAITTIVTHLRCVCSRACPVSDDAGERRSVPPNEGVVTFFAEFFGEPFVMRSCSALIGL